MRQRHVFDTREIGHLWFHRTQDDARNPQDNFYFRGDTIYSYGPHFPIARHVSSRKYGDAILFTRHTYSNTTAKHVGIVRRAIPSGAKQFYVNDVTADNPKEHADNWKDYLDRIQDASASLVKRRTESTKSRDRANLLWLIQNANEYAEFFGMRQRIRSEGEPIELASKILAERAKLDKLEHNRRAKLDKLREKQNHERLVKWLSGESGCLPSWTSQIYLRVSGEDIETSLGARFPTDHARRALPIIRHCIDNQEHFQTNGRTIHLGPYSIDRIEPDGTVHAGCHVVHWSEIERIAKLLGLISSEESAVV
jgi:hypothetical protein